MTNKLTEEKKKVLRETISGKSSDCTDCSDCSNCSYCSDCSDCSYCSDCSSCSDCSDCSRKKYMIKNVQFTKEEYKAWKKNLI